MALLQKIKHFWHDTRAMVSLEIAFATPILLGLALSCVEVTNYVLFTQKIDRAVTTVADLTAQARGLSINDLNNIHDAATYIMQPYTLAQNGSVIVSAISPADDGNPVVNWQWRSSETQTSQFGSANGAATLPNAFVVRSGESIIVSELYIPYEPIILQSLFPSTPSYQYAIFRPRFDALTALD